MNRGMATSMGVSLTTMALIAASSDAAQAQVGASQAGSQSTDPVAQTPNSPSSGEAGGQVGDVIVTARKRAETIISAPVAVTALSAVEMAKRGIQDLQTLSDFAPGLKYENQSASRNDRGFHTLVIRGLYPGTDVPERQTGSVFLDGVPVFAGAIDTFADVQQTEVVKGPQSAYFGRSTFAGAVNFITRAPSFEPAAYVEGSYGSFGSYELKGSAEGGLVKDVLSVRVNVQYRERGPQYDDYGFAGRLGEQTTKHASVSLLFTPVERLRIRAFVSRTIDDDGSPASGQLGGSSIFGASYANDYNCTTPTGVRYICGAIKSVPLNRITQLNNIGQTQLNYLEGITPTPAGIFTQTPLGSTFLQHFGLYRRDTLAYGTLEYEFAGGLLLNANVAHLNDDWSFLTDTGFRNTEDTPNPIYGTAAGTANNVLPFYARLALGQSKIDDTSTEVRLTSPASWPVKVLAGFNYLQFHNQSATGVFSTNGLTPTYATINGGDTYGLFGSLGYSFGHGFSGSVEGREQSDRISQRSLAPINPINVHSTNRSFTPRVILQYEPRPDINLYASYAQGTRPGTFNTTYYANLSSAQQAQVTASGFNVPLAVPEEHLSMEEVGFKANLFDRKLRILASAYLGNWTDKQIVQQVYYTSNGLPSGAAATTQVTLPGGHILLHGIELETTFRPTRELTFDATFNYAGTYIRKSFCAECVTLLGIANGSATGNSLPRYPVTAGTFSTTYRRHAFSSYDGYGRVDYIYTGRQYDSETNLAWTAPSSRVNLHVGLDNGKYAFEFYGTNIFNDKTPLSIARSTDAFFSAINTLAVSPADRATFGIRGSAHF